MTWLLLGLLALAALAPLGFILLRPARTRGRREADLALYRAQLAELEREREAGRLDEAAHRAAMLEVQRRLLAAPEEGSASAAPGRGRAPLLAALVAVPVLAFGVYLVQGTPDMPSAPYSLRHAQEERDEQLLAMLRNRLAQMDQNSDAARQGYVLLGNAERSRGRLEAAADAYRHALAGHFDADLTGQLAQVLLEDGKVEDAARLLAAALPQAPRHIGLRFLSGLAEARAGRPEVARSTWRALITEAPEGAPWRAMVERRMQDLP
jgi:cytochrome c-type biogenesis protein CcmH